ncbi:MAG: carboxypeptidase-like regulatory domain-containing protein [Muribaculaceae bacterium]|nr:carboxypeptidase-like regulatory domain-containing protein [Muribaculaceae bacterium]
MVCSMISLHAQTQIAGYVRDSLTREPIPFASIALLGTDEGVTAGDHGGFQINSATSVAVLRVTAMGYKPKNIALRQYQSVVVVDLVSQAVALDEVVVKRTKEKYSKKDNPAVALAKRLMALKNQGAPTDEPFYSHKRYERMMYGFNDFDKVKDKNLLLRRFAFLADYADTSTVTGKRVLPIAIKEQLSHEYYRNRPKTHKELIIGQKNAGLDSQLDTQSGVKRLMDDWFQEVDIFANDVTFLTNRFVSPLSTIGPDFYKYYLSDTLMVDGEQCIELSFTPFVSETFGFLGRIYVIENDSTLFIKKVKLNVPSHINLNYVDRVYIEQDFERAAGGARLKVRDDMEIEFSILKGPGLFARREAAYTAFSFAAPDDMTVFDLKGEQRVMPDADKMPDAFWAGNRPLVMKTDENSMRQMLARLRQSKMFYWTEKVIVALVKGYVPTGANSKWDFGPLNTTISGNSLEGLRLRLGGMSTVKLDRHWFVRAYAAYGTKDRKWKYSGQVEYSINEKKELDQEFPIHSIKLRHTYDVDRLGQHYLYTNSDNMFLALKRQSDNKMIYRRQTLLEWKLETLNHFSISVGFEHLVRESSRYLHFIMPDSTVRHSYHEAGFNVTLRYAPGEKFYQMRTARIPINMDAPIITLSHTYMPKGFMGSLYEVNKTELGLQKRFWFSAFGYTDIIVKGGKIWSKVPYPDLLLPNANLSYTIQNESYALMDVMEFANDQYLSWDVTYFANGALLNRIPLVKHLKLREVFTFRGLWGSLSDRNNPAKSNDVFLFPADTRCQKMGSKPYMEIGVGLDNILTFLRLDYVWRLTYRDTPGVKRGGLRLALHFTF